MRVQEAQEELGMEVVSMRGVGAPKHDQVFDAIAFNTHKLLRCPYPLFDE